MQLLNNNYTVMILKWIVIYLIAFIMLNSIQISTKYVSLVAAALVIWDLLSINSSDIKRGYNIPIKVHVLNYA